MPIRVKSSDEARNTTTTFAADSDLSVTLAANTTYLVDVQLRVNSGATPDFKSTLSFSGTLTRAGLFQQYNDHQLSKAAGPSTGRGLAGFTAATFTAATAFPLSGSDTAGAFSIVRIRGIVVVGASGGTFAVEWAQNTSNGGNTTVFAGSYLKYEAQADVPGVLIVKTGDTTRTTDTSRAADPDLQFTALAGRKYLLRLGIMFWGQTTPDIKYALSVGGTPIRVTGIQCRTNMDSPTSPPPSTVIVGHFNAGLTGTPVEISGTGTGSSTDRGLLEITCSVEMAASNATVAYEWAQNTSSANNTTVFAPSYLWYEDVS